MPKPNAKCGFGFRSILNFSGSSKTDSSRFAQAIIGRSISFAGIVTPATSISRVVLRIVTEKGECTLRVSSTNVGISAGLSFNSAKVSGISLKTLTIPVMSPVVVSLPAISSRRQKLKSSSLLSLPSSVSVAIRRLSRLSLGESRSAAMRPRKYLSICSLAALASGLGFASRISPILLKMVSDHSLNLRISPSSTPSM